MHDNWQDSGRQFDQTYHPGTASSQESCKYVWVAAVGIFSLLSTYHHGVVRKDKSLFAQPRGIIADEWNKVQAIFRLKMAGVLFSLLSPSEWCEHTKPKSSPCTKSKQVEKSMRTVLEIPGRRDSEDKQ